MPLLRTGLMASLLITLQLPLFAQTIDVDITPGHSTNQFVPTEWTRRPDGPPVGSKITGDKDTAYVLPAASITVLRGNISK